MPSLIEINEENFQKEILQSNLPVLLEFGAPWCAPCKNMEPVMLEMAAKWDGKLRTARLNVDESVNLVQQYQVMSAPTLVLFVSGQEVERLVGSQTPQRMRAKFEPHL